MEEFRKDPPSRCVNLIKHLKIRPSHGRIVEIITNYFVYSMLHRKKWRLSDGQT